MTTLVGGRKRLTYQLDSPFSTDLWPEITPEDQDTILELLCNLLSPIGQHRRSHIKPSRGKRAAKRKRQGKETECAASQAQTPPKPELDAKIDVGLNSISRTLEDLSHTSPGHHTSPTATPAASYSMIFVARGNQSSTFNCHFPQMVGVASEPLPTSRKIRLVGFSKSCSDRLSTCLGLARVSSIGIKADAPNTEALWAVVEKAVSPVDISWLDGTKCKKFEATVIKSLETPIGLKKTK